MLYPETASGDQKDLTLSILELWKLKIVILVSKPKTPSEGLFNKGSFTKAVMIGSYKNQLNLNRNMKYSFKSADISECVYSISSF